MSLPLQAADANGYWALAVEIRLTGLPPGLADNVTIWASITGTPSAVAAASGFNVATVTATRRRRFQMPARSVVWNVASPSMVACHPWRAPSP